ncbi:MAG TPA: TRAP transporter large permease subunit [Methylomirabilota bacterium]|nr:TRAP transporter large permease subunit [Methylomirabilota bacterium]
MVVLLEIGFITPPVGLNLFVIQGLMAGTGAREVTTGTTPFVVLMVLLVVILFVFPDLELWLPAHMMHGRGSGRVDFVRGRGTR